VDLQGDYSNGGAGNLGVWETSRNIELDRHQTPMLIGEVGLSPNVTGFDDYLKDFMAMADRMQASWTYWSNDPGGWGPLDGNLNESPILQEVIRTYPKAIAGRLLGFSFDPYSKIFELTFVSDADISMPTEIFIPQRFYEGGWNLEVMGTDHWSQSWNPLNQTLSFSTTDDASEITIRVTPD
jgi:endoglycosylceramidase